MKRELLPQFPRIGIRRIEVACQNARGIRLNIITEVRDATQIDDVIEYADIIQIGAKSM